MTNHTRVTEALRRRGYADGRYSCRCQSCKKEFEGDKRASTCKECALSAALEAALATEYHPSVIHYEEGDYSQMLLRDCPTVTGHPPVSVQPLIDIETRELVGFQWHGKSPALASTPDVVRVKPLEWTSENPFHTARTNFGFYSIEPVDYRVSYFELKGSFIWPAQKYATLNEAKAAAQSDYSARIMSALTSEAREDRNPKRLVRALKLIAGATCIVYDEALNTMVEVAMDEKEMANIARGALAEWDSAICARASITEGK